LSIDKIMSDRIIFWKRNVDAVSPSRSMGGKKRGGDTASTLLALLIFLSASAQASYVTIGGTGVAADSATGYGGVNYSYQISQYEVTGAEFGAAVADDPNIGNSNPNTGSKPAEYVSWYGAVKYCNWLTSGDAYLGAYTHSGGSFTGIDRASAISTYGTVYVLPTEDEWYKAAYWRNDVNDQWSLYAHGVDTDPTHGSTTEGWNYRHGIYGYATPDQRPWEVGYGAQEQNGTYDMMGNVWEWTEDDYSALKKVPRGGGCANNVSDLSSTARGGGYPDREYSSMGLRVVMVPEPSSILLFFIGGVSTWIVRRERVRRKNSVEKQSNVV